MSPEATAVRRLRSVLDPLGFAILIVFAWGAIVRITGIHSVLLPGPERVWAVVVRSGPTFFTSMLDTMITVGWGFLFGGLLGFVSGVLISYFDRVRRAIYAGLVALYVVPKAVFIPLFIIWWGVGLPYKVVITLLLVFFPVTENTIAGLQAVEPEMMELTESLRGGTWFSFRKVKLPSALPHILAGLRIGVTEAFIGAVLSELLVPHTGIGSRIMEATLFSNTQFIIAGILFVGAFGIVTYLLVERIERRLTFWYY